jgi:hypothetical protein
MSKEILLTQERLKVLFWYDPASGVFRRRLKQKGNAPWSVAGCKTKDPYTTIGIDRRIYPAHRLAFLYMTGAFPKYVVDHIDGNGLNNAWSNLRPATSKQNSENQKVPCRNTSGFRGVSFDRQSGKWRATVGVPGSTGKSRNVHVGLFATAEEAGRAAHIKRLELYTHYERERT